MMGDLVEKGVRVPPKVVHTINNQLTIVIGRAAMLAAETDDVPTKERCEEIKTAVQEISRLLNTTAVRE
jgi:hypothetical protein